MIFDGTVKLQVDDQYLYKRLSRLSEQSGGHKYVVPAWLGVLVYIRYYWSNKKFIRDYVGGDGFTLKSLKETLKNINVSRNSNDSELLDLLESLDAIRACN